VHEVSALQFKTIPKTGTATGTGTGIGTVLPSSRINTAYAYTEVFEVGVPKKREKDA